MAKQCKKCGYEAGTSYSLWEFDSPFVQSFKPVQAVKGLIWVTCSKCAQDWLMNRYGENHNTVDLDPLPKENKETFDFWAQTDLSPTQEQMDVLAKIVGLNGDGYGLKITAHAINRLYIHRVTPDGKVTNKLDRNTEILRNTLEITGGEND